MCAAGEFNRFGFPKPVAGARLVTDFGDEGHAARPPLRVQQALSRLVLRAAGLMRPYVFVDEWDVAAPREAVFAAIADARTYPRVVAPGVPRRRRRRPGRAGQGVAPALQGAPALPPAHALARRRARGAAHGDRRGRRRPARPRDVDADADRDRHPRALRLAGPRRPQAAARRSRRSCARSSAGTTTGPSRARWRASSPTRGAPPDAAGRPTARTSPRSSRRTSRRSACA